MEERGHVLKVLKEVKLALREQKYIEIKNLSNEITHQASIHQDPDLISVAVIIYSLSKLLERKNYKEQKNWERFYREYIQGIENLIKNLEKDDINGFRNQVNLIRKLIQGLSGKLKIYIQDIFRNAKINKASRIYEHGISMQKTAKILGVSVWELSEYAGKTGIGNVNLGITMPIQQRVKLAEEIFG